MSIEELASKGSTQSREAFEFLRKELKSNPIVQETLEYEPIKNSEAPSYNIRETPRVRVFFGDKLEIFLFIPEKAVQTIKNDDSIPQSLRAWVDRAQLGGMSRLLRVQVSSRRDIEVLIPLVKAVTRS
jgi:hypothetical protein